MAPEYPRLSAEARRWVARQVHPRARVTATSSLPGGLTAAMDRITVDRPGGPVDVVLRRWPDAEEAADHLVTREAAALAAVEGHGVPAPRLLALDATGAEAGVRCTLTSALPGQPDLTPADRPSWLGQLAATQAAIHAVPDPSPAPRDPGTPDRYAVRYRPLDWLTDRALRDAAREAAAGPLPDERVMVHGDYQHFNVLWWEGRLSGVVDWPHAGVGIRGSDVGHCRLNLAVLLDAGAAADYLVGYERAAGVRVDRRADLRALLCFDLDWTEFIPRQVAGRAPLDLPGMAGRVADTVRAALEDLG